MDNELAVAIRSLHDTLETCLKAVEPVARECAEMAILAEQDGYQEMADILRHLGRSHKVKALELAAKLAILKEQHHNLLRPEA